MNLSQSYSSYNMTSIHTEAEMEPDPSPELRRSSNIGSLQVSRTPASQPPAV
jgi:hypothetical protein